MPLKADAEEILEYMQQLPSSLGLDRNRRWWWCWLYRSDHVENAAEILNSGRLLSRAAAEKRQVIRVDSGAPHYVGQLTKKHRNLVRLYFRPRTPTQYTNEGIRPREELEYGVQMPVPVYLLFAVSLLGEEGMDFTKGRLEQGTAVGGSAEFLKSIDFGDVYHDSGVGSLGNSRRPEILNARHSEVVVKNELSLDKLKHIVCRSPAERETLLNLLTPEASARWLKMIRVDEGDRRMFEKRGTFVKKARLFEYQFPVPVLHEQLPEHARAVRSHCRVDVWRTDGEKTPGWVLCLKPASCLFAQFGRTKVSRSRTARRKPGLSGRLRRTVRI